MKSQFRCNGSDNYLEWLEQVLYNSSNNVHNHFDENDYEFGVYKDPQKLYDKIVSLNKGKQVARLCAGYCWKWSTELDSNGDLKKDVVIGDFKMPWETNNVQAKGIYAKKYASSADTWAIEPEGINQIGCIYTMQGFEIDYVGVILGPDVKYDKENDRLVGVIGQSMIVKNSDPEVFTRLTLNSYRVLMSRGRKGCFIYSVDPAVSDFIQRNLAKPEEKTITKVIPLQYPNAAEPVEDFNKIVHEVDDSEMFSTYLPFYTLRAACGYFGEGEYVEQDGWVKVEDRKLNRNMFVVRAEGSSMEPKIHNGDLCIFSAGVAGSRNNKIVLVQYRGEPDPDTAGSFTIKEYRSTKSYDPQTGEWQHEQIRLHPLNKLYDDIVIDNVETEDDFRVVGEFISVV